MNTPIPRRAAAIGSPSYELFMLQIVVLWVANSAALTFDLLPQQRDIAEGVNRAISAWFVVDLCARLVRAARAGGLATFLTRETGWLLVLGTVPLPLFAAARAAWAFVQVRRLRRSEMAALGESVARGRGQTTVLLVLFVAIVVFELCGMLILSAEAGDPSANIRSAQDALWWGYVTIATVGYGDRFPVTPQGRLIAAVLMTLGIALFSAVTGFLADWFRRPRRRRSSAETRSSADATSVAAELATTLDRMERDHAAAVSELRARLAELENRLSDARQPGQGVPPPRG